MPDGFVIPADAAPSADELRRAAWVGDFLGTLPFGLPLPLFGMAAWVCSV